MLADIWDGDAYMLNLLVVYHLNRILTHAGLDIHEYGGTDFIARESLGKIIERF